MIATTTETNDSGRAVFLDRVSVVHRQSERMRMAFRLSSAALSCLVGVVLIAAADYVWELSWGVRGLLLGVVMSGVLAVTLSAWWQDRQRRAMSRTVSNIETTFPELGQRARTSLQFGRESEDELRSDGVRPEMVAALIDDTQAKSADLPLVEVVPRRRLGIVVGVLAAMAMGVGLLSVDAEWRTALSRSLLSDVPYTEVVVLPGNVTVATGASVAVTVELTGRTNRDVTLQYRDVDAASDEWVTQTMVADRLSNAADKSNMSVRDKSVASSQTAESGADDQRASFGAGLDGIGTTMVYRVMAGPERSREYRIRVLDRLTIRQVDAEVESPVYTRLPPRQQTDGHVTALRGSVVRFRIELSRAPAEVAVILQQLPTGKHAAEEFEDVTFDGSIVTFTLPVDRNLLWTLSAITADGIEVPKQPFRVRVTEDHAPKLSFEDPEDGIEVHTLAELPLRVRVADDYGLTRAGIVFQINNGDEFTLLEENFDELAAALADVTGRKADSEASLEISREAGQEAESSERLTPQTRSVLERLLPLEHFSLSQKDAVMYYAFAEDNFPSQPHRTESDRRFIDIRPLMQVFRLRENDGNGGGSGGLGVRLTSLSELIRRERGLFNRTIGLSKRGGTVSDRDVLAYDRLMRSQAEVANLTRQLAIGLQARGIDDVDALYQAERAMLGAVDSLSVGDVESAILQEKDAQQYLVEGRERAEMQIAQNPTENINYQQLRDFNQTINQKMRRRPQLDPQGEEQAQMLIARLLRLARSEEEISRRLMAGRPDKTPKDLEDADAMSASVETTDEPNPLQDKVENLSQDSISQDEDEEQPAETTGGADGVMVSEEDVEPEDGLDGPGAVEMETLIEQQVETLADTREIAEGVNNLEAATELTKERLGSITVAMESIVEDMRVDEANEAAQTANRTARALRELARQVSGLTQGDVFERVGFARALSEDLTRRQRELADGMVDRETTPDDRADRAADLAERAQTLEDVLRAIAQSTNPDDGDAADRVTEIVEDQNVSELRQDLQALAGKLNEPIEQPSEQPVASAGEVDGATDEASEAVIADLNSSADRSERLSLSLDRLVRQLQTPIIERLRDLEQEAAEIAEKAERVDGDREADKLTKSLAGLLEELEQSNLGGGARDELLEMLRRKSGTSMRDRRDQQIGFSIEVQDALRGLVEELQLELQELVLAETDLDVDSPVPTQYESLVEQYLKVLSTGD